MSAEIKKVSELSDSELDSVGAGQWRDWVITQTATQTQTQSNAFTGPVAVSGLGEFNLTQVNEALAQIAQSATQFDDIN